ELGEPPTRRPRRSVGQLEPSEQLTLPRPRRVSTVAVRSFFRVQSMGDQPDRLARPRSSRQRYRGFVQDNRQRRLDEKADGERNGRATDERAKADEAAEAAAEAHPERRAKRREYLREYMRWLWPHRYAV